MTEKAHKCSGEKMLRGRCLECGEQIEPAPVDVAPDVAPRGIGSLFEAKASAADVADVIAQVGEIAGRVSDLLTLPADVEALGSRLAAAEGKIATLELAVLDLQAAQPPPVPAVDPILPVPETSDAAFKERAERRPEHHRKERG